MALEALIVMAEQQSELPRPEVCVGAAKPLQKIKVAVANIIFCFLLRDC